jgi:cell division protein ZapE
VGRGKTYLMDLFFDALPFRRKIRMHFHRFMQRVHKELNELKGEKNPLELVADKIHADAVVICFDEFFVTDITDAMLLHLRHMIGNPTAAEESGAWREERFR